MIPTATNVEDGSPSSWETTSGSAVVIDGDGALPTETTSPCGDADEPVDEGVGVARPLVGADAVGDGFGDRLGDGVAEAEVTGVFAGS
jgi:hypothetical protein